MIKPDKLNSIYVIILNYQSYQDTIKYVECLQKQENINLNILIVDNCSPNKSFDILKKEFLEISNVDVIISERNGGYAYGNNFGLHYLEKKPADFVLISNNDIEITDTLLLSKMTQEYKKLANPAFIAPVMYSNGFLSEYSAWRIPTLKDDIIESLRVTSFMFKSRIKYKITDGDLNIMAVDCLPGSFFLSKKEIFYKIDLMDEKTFLYGEEVILAQKVKTLGLQNYLIKSLNYEHSNSQTISKQVNKFKMREYLTESKMYYHQKYFGYSILQTKILRILFQLWKVESILYEQIRKIVAQKN